MFRRVTKVTNYRRGWGPPSCTYRAARPPSQVSYFNLQEQIQEGQQEVCCGYDSNGIVDLFEATQAHYYRGQVIPLCAGWIGEINEVLDKIIRMLA